MIDRIVGVVLLLAVGVLVSCSESEPGPNKGPSLEPVVMTSFYPTAYFASRIAGGAVEVRCPLPAGEDPAFWQPSAGAVEAYQRARLVVLNGAGFEKWVDRVSLPSSRVVDTTGGLGDRLLRLEKSFTHSHGTTGEHSHTGMDGHTWLSPAMAREQARAIRDAMARVWPEHGSAFEAGAGELDRDLGRLADRLERLTGPMRSARVLGAHPAYNYLARDFGWTIQNLALDPGEPLDEHALSQIGELVGDTGEASGGGVTLMLWESEPLEATSALLGDRFGIVSVVFSPCESDPGAGGGGDYLAAMNANIDRLAEGLGVPRP